MEITDVFVRLIRKPTDRLRAFCSVTFGGVFVVRDMKIVDGTNGLFVAMPSRRISSNCPRCRHRNDIGAKKCEACNAKLHADSSAGEGRNKLYRDIAHPITTEFRETLQKTVLEAYEEEVKNADLPQDDADEMASEDCDVTSEASDDMSGNLEDTLDAEKESPEPEDDSSSVSEYDSLIAGLKGGREESRESKPATRGRRESKTKRSDTRAQGRQRSDRSPRKKDTVKASAVPSETCNAPSKDDVKPVKSSFGAGILSSNEAPGEPVSKGAPKSVPVKKSASGGSVDHSGEVELASEASQPHTTEDSCDDSTAFGAGIL